MLGTLRRAFSFSSWTTNHPREPPPGDMLDASFDAQDQRISEIEVLVSDLRRSDGALQNGVVGADQLSPDLKSLLRIPTAQSDNGDQLGWKTAEATADVWAHASADWAEHMPDTIPGNSVAVMDITGDHWSARWWAHQAAITVGSKFGGIIISDTAPPDPHEGLCWWSSVTGNLMIWYIDQDSGQWVQINTAANAGEPEIPVGTSAQYWRGDKSWQTLDKTAAGLGNVDNTSDANKPVSTAQQTALNLKANLAGATFTGKVIGTPTATDAAFNIGISTAPSTPVNGDVWFNSATAILSYRISNVNVAVINDTNNQAIAGTKQFISATRFMSGTATPAGGATTANINFGTAQIGIYFGSGAPSITAAQGSLYLRTDGSSNVTRMYVNTTGAAVWTAVNTVA